MNLWSDSGFLRSGLFRSGKVRGTLIHTGHVGLAMEQHVLDTNAGKQLS
jgi:hypothetical protein